MGVRDNTGLIDFMSICIQHKMTVHNILMSEICNNQQYGSAFNLLQRCCCALLMELPEFKHEEDEEWFAYLIVDLSQIIFISFPTLHTR